MASFKKDLFISYAHIDNQPLAPDEQGWITQLHASLETTLGMRMGGKAKIWREDKLQRNDVFADEIVGSIREHRRARFCPDDALPQDPQFVLYEKFISAVTTRTSRTIRSYTRDRSGFGQGSACIFAGRRLPSTTPRWG